MKNKANFSAQLPTAWGSFTIHALQDLSDKKEHIVLSMGNLSNEQPLLVRIHSECLTGDVFSSLRCDCGPQLDAAFQSIAKAGSGLIIYLRQEGRGIGLTNKIKAYALQEQGHDTVDANLHLGFEADERDFKVAAEILSQFSITKVRLMTNNPRKIKALQSANIQVERIPLTAGRNPHNENYLSTKQDKLGHHFD